MLNWLYNTGYVFLCLLLIPFFVGLVPAGIYYAQIWEPLVTLVGDWLSGGRSVIHYSANGSGDTLYNWVLQITILTLSIVIGGLVTVVVKDRWVRSRFGDWLGLMLVVYLSYFMLTYGLAKLLELQFPRPSLTRTYESYGGSSPMRLLWTFMGYSRPYIVFTGLLEIAAGLLLLPRMTRTVGALLTVGIMTHVLILNLSYDVPVKIFSAQLILVAGVLLWADRDRLWQFVTNQPIEPRAWPQLFGAKWGRIVLGIGMLLLVSVPVTLSMIENVGASAVYRERSPLYGIYAVTSFVKNDVAVPAITIDGDRWKRVVFDHPKYATVTTIYGRTEIYRCAIDTSRQNFSLSHMQSGELYVAAGYTLVDGVLKLTGRLSVEPIIITAEAVDLTTLGINRGFHWVNEVPYNHYQY